MENTKTCENFPLYMVFLSNLFTISMYLIGAYILAGIGIIFAILYLIYCAGMEIRLLKSSCVNCYYYGKICGFGKGKLCSLFFKKGDPEKFAGKNVLWFEMLPDFLIIIFPAIGGIISLINNFNWVIIIMMIILFLLFFGGNAIIRGQFTCKYCKQREIGCPADKLFNSD